MEPWDDAWIGDAAYDNGFDASDSCGFDASDIYTPSWEVNAKPDTGHGNHFDLPDFPDRVPRSNGAAVTDEQLTGCLIGVLTLVVLVGGGYFFVCLLWGVVWYVGECTTWWYSQVTSWPRTVWLGMGAVAYVTIPPVFAWGWAKRPVVVLMTLCATTTTALLIGGLVLLVAAIPTWDRTTWVFVCAGLACASALLTGAGLIRNELARIREDD